MKQQSAIKTAIVNSAIRAFDQYLKMSDGECWVHETPEYWYTSAIATGISDAIPNRHVVIENSVSEIRFLANRNKKGRATNAYRTSGNADISLWTKKWKPRTIIEIKKTWSWRNGDIGKDVERIVASLDETGRKEKLGTIDGGFLIILTDKKNSKKHSAEDQLKKLHKVIQKSVGRKIPVSSKRTVVTTLHLGKAVPSAKSRMAIIICEFA